VSEKKFFEKEGFRRKPEEDNKSYREGVLR
jgi:hypothetical protein